MEFWQRHMPGGMLLRSSKRSSHMGDPKDGFRLDDYVAQHGTVLGNHVPLEEFIKYGCWFQRNLVPECERQRVTGLDVASNGFRLLLNDGKTVYAKFAIVAAGIGPFAHRPQTFNGLSAEKVSHSSDHANLQRFAGMRVVVIGAGQSAFESAALLLENGADVEIVARADRVIWLSSTLLPSLPSRLRRMLDPGTDVGPPGLNQLVARPRIFASLPYRLREPIAQRCIRPAVAGWLKSRVAEIQVTMPREVTGATTNGKGVRLHLNDGTTRDADHVLLATGFCIDISRYSFIGGNLFTSISQFRGYPLVTLGFESSIRGLFFAGATSALSLGPLFRFVAGTGYCAAIISNVIGARLGSSPIREHTFARAELRAG
jgi:FAD-dependent urate hydroxylase